MADPLEEFSGEPLSPTENKKARKIIRDKERMDWLMSVMLVWSGYFAAFVTGMYAARDYVAEVFRAILS